MKLTSTIMKTPTVKSTASRRRILSGSIAAAGAALICMTAPAWAADINLANGTSMTLINPPDPNPSNYDSLYLNGNGNAPTTLSVTNLTINFGGNADLGQEIGRAHV